MYDRPLAWKSRPHSAKVNSSSVVVHNCLGFKLRGIRIPFSNVVALLYSLIIRNIISDWISSSDDMNTLPKTKHYSNNEFSRWNSEGSQTEVLSQLPLCHQQSDREETQQVLTELTYVL